MKMVLWVKKYIRKKIGNSTYFFDETGKMKTGAFWIDRKGYLAEADGSIVNCKNSWYYMKSNQKWYYFDENGVYDETADSSMMVALTFDDGPGAHTGELLDTLKQYGAKATFFSSGCEY